jgi:hypothetical protein
VIDTCADFSESYPEIVKIATATRLFLDGYGADGPRFMECREPEDISEGKPVSLYNCIEATHFLRENLRQILPAADKNPGFWTPAIVQIKADVIAGEPDERVAHWHVVLIGFPDGLPEDLLQQLRSSTPGKDGLGFLHIANDRQIDTSGTSSEAIDTIDLLLERKFFETLGLPQAAMIDITADQVGFPPVLCLEISSCGPGKIEINDNDIGLMSFGTFVIETDERPIDFNKSTLESWKSSWSSLADEILENVGITSNEKGSGVHHS